MTTEKLRCAVLRLSAISDKEELRREWNAFAKAYTPTDPELMSKEESEERLPLLNELLGIASPLLKEAN